LCAGDGEGFQRLARGKIERRTFRERGAGEGRRGGWHPIEGEGKGGKNPREAGRKYEAREDYKQGGRLEKEKVEEEEEEF